MKILIIGSGGREHALAWKAAKSPKVDKIFCAPGNGGIAEFAQCVEIGAMEFEKLADFAEENKIDLTLVGMDDPLVGGVVDVLSLIHISRRPLIRCAISPIIPPGKWVMPLPGLRL